MEIAGFKVSEDGLRIEAVYVEYADMGSLSAYMRKNLGEIKAATRYRWMIQITDCLVALHQAGFAHRTLKGNHALLCSRYDGGIDAKLSPPTFGSSRFVNEDVTRTYINNGGSAYMPPEVLKGLKENKMHFNALQADIYSLGCIFFLIVFGVEPYLHYLNGSSSDPDNEDSGLVQWQKILKHGVRLADTISPFLVLNSQAKIHELIRACTEFDPEMRPSIEEVRERLGVI